jgi:hypothetical protein
MGMAQTVGLRQSFPTFFLIAKPFRWFFSSRRRVLGLVAVVLLMIVVPPIWWAIQLLGLPDIGEPFDVEAFRATSIPDDRNAFLIYRRAAQVLKPPPEEKSNVGQAKKPASRWSAAGTEVQQWVLASREALSLYRQAAEKPDAFEPSLDLSGRLSRTLPLARLQRLALLEASRLEEQGDMAGAWAWYRSYLRTIHLAGRWGSVYKRHEAQTWHKLLLDRLTGWSADAKTIPVLLRQALDDVIACEAIAPSDSYALKTQYLLEASFLEARKLPHGRMPPAWLIALASRPGLRPLIAIVTPDHMEAISAAWMFWRREPERSRRVLELVTANRLAYYDLPPDKRPKPDPNIASCDVYDFGPEAPAKARVLSAELLGGWLDSTYAPRELIECVNLHSIRTGETASHHALIMLLATELYRRDHSGRDHETPQELVGPYLKQLPREFPEEDHPKDMTVDE